MDIALAIVRHPSTNAILLARRPDAAHQGGLWEFPGGKCQPGEAPADCAVRETLEETGLNVSVLEAWPVVPHVYPDRTVVLHPFFCRAFAADALPLASVDVRWVVPSDMGQYAFPPANAPLLARLRAL